VPAEPGTEHDIDSLAVWQTAPGEAIVLVTAKQGDQIWVHDASTGELIRRVGGPGSGPGEFERPNGIAVVDDLAIVVERDNARLQVLRLPDFEHLGFAGEAELTRPYGIAAFASEQGIEVYITDNYETPDEQIPPVAELGRRVRHFRLHDRGDSVDAELVSTFGDTAGDGILHKVETIAVDPARNRLLVVDELETELAIRVYTLDGTYVGTMGAGIFAYEPEGIALFETADGGGDWIATDQQSELSLFLVFDRDTLEYLGGFTGEVTANTDGVTLTQLPLEAFPEGAFYAVNDDATVTAFDWRDIARALGL
jgi:3-phytase